MPHWQPPVRGVVADLDLRSYLAETPQQIFYALLLGVTCHLVPGTGVVRFGDHVVGIGDAFFMQVRALGLDHGLVDNKVCAIDATWSGLRFAHRRT